MSCKTLILSFGGDVQIVSLLQPCCSFIVTWSFCSLKHWALANCCFCNKLKPLHFATTLKFNILSCITLSCQFALVPLILPSPYLQVKHELKNFYFIHLIYIFINLLVFCFLCWKTKLVGRSLFGGLSNSSPGLFTTSHEMTCNSYFSQVHVGISCRIMFQLL